MVAPTRQSHLMLWLFAIGFALYFFAFRAAADAWAARRRDPGGKPARCGLAGHEVARCLLQANHAGEVGVVKARGSQTARFDPRKNQVLLGSDAYAGKSLAALAMAAVAAAEACTPDDEQTARANRRLVTGVLHPALGVLLVLACIAAVIRPVLWRAVAGGWILAGVVLLLGHAMTLAWEYKLVARAMTMLVRADLLGRGEEEDCDTLRKGLALRDVKGLGAAVARIATALLPFKGW